MDKTSVIGIILGIVAIGIGMILKGVHPTVLLNPAAILIILVGTLAALCIAFPTHEIMKLPKLFKVLFSEKKGVSYEEIIESIIDLAQVARRDGLLSLEAKLNEVDDPFLRSGLGLTIDGHSAEVIHDILLEEINAMEERHQANASIFSQAGTYAPTLGVLGAVIGLIAALGNMEDMEKLGHAIAAAFVATLMGIFTGYVLWHPFANKLKRKSKEEVRRKELMIEGILSIQEGQAPALIKQKLASFLPIKQRLVFLEEGDSTDA